MKYLKLFENWLNEAEEGSKTFSPDKPWETLVFDVSNEDMFGNTEKLNTILKSILAKSFDKTELKDSNSVSVVTLYPYDFSADSKGIILYSKPSGQGDKYVIKTDVVKFSQKLKSIGIEFTDFRDNQVVYLVTLGTNQNWKDGENNIKIDPKTFFVFADNKPQDEKPVLNSEWVAVTDIQNPTKVTLGQIAAYSSTKFENLATLKDKSLGSIVSIAKMFGYEIPETYTPKKDEVKKIAK